MKIIINSCFGGFGVNKNILDKYNLKDSSDLRINNTLIKLVESGVNCNDELSRLEIVEIPDESTDFYIEEYDGVENVLYVLNGKIHVA